jgi:hypothetical protein
MPKKKDLGVDASELRRSVERHDIGNAFFPDPEGGKLAMSDDLARELGSAFIQSALSGEARADLALYAEVSEEWGGPFVEMWAGEELGLAGEQVEPPRHGPALGALRGA